MTYLPSVNHGQLAGVAQVTRNSLLLLAFLTGCSPVAPSTHEHLAAVDYWPEQQLLFLAMPRSGAIDVLRVPSSPRQGSLDFVERLTEPTRQEVVRLAVDRIKGRLWVADRRIIYIYQFWPRGPSTQIPFGSPGAALITDLVIDANGNGYVFLDGGALIHRVASGTLQAEKWFETTYRSFQSGVLLPNRAIVTKDGRQALFQSPKDGGLLRLDLASRQAVKMQRETPIALDCATLLWNDDWGGDGYETVTAGALTASITAFHCRGRSIGQIEFDPEMRRSRERYVTLHP